MKISQSKNWIKYYSYQLPSETYLPHNFRTATLLFDKIDFCVQISTFFDSGAAEGGIFEINKKDWKIF